MRPKSSTSSATIIAIIVLALIILVESIALTITLTNYFGLFSSEIDYDTATESDYIYPGNNFNYSKDGKLISMDAKCASDDYGYILFSKDNTFQQYNNSNELIDKGSYTITNSIVISLTNNSSKRLLSFDGFRLADEEVMYDCEDSANE